MGLLGGPTAAPAPNALQHRGELERRGEVQILGENASPVDFAGRVDLLFTPNTAAILDRAVDDQLQHVDRVVEVVHATAKAE